MPTDVDAAEGLVRVRVVLERSPGEEGPTEDWLWAEPLGSGRFRVESCPFFAYGISRDDVVRAADGAEAGAPQFDEVVEKSGHRTLRVALDAAVEIGSREVQRLLGQLIERGCTHELLRPKLLAIDLPPEADVALVAELLEHEERAGTLVWEWADPRPS
jgi:hypothetical protein